MNFFESFPYTTGDIFDGRYHIDDICRGNMGLVMLCQDTETDQPIAIKTIDSQYLHSDEALKIFLDEASTWIQLERHPNIVQAYSLKMIDDRPYLFLERIVANNFRGTTLKDLLFTKPIAPKRMIQIAIHICDGMIYALDKFPELVHRDLKTENILIGIDDLPKISDFGMTLRVENYVDDWESQSLLKRNQFNPVHLARKLEGTPSFASPEQCRNEPLDTRTDIYACGCIFYQIATKHTPFVRPTVEDYIIAHIRETPKHPNECSTNVPTEFGAAIMTCLKKDPDERYQTFNDLRRDLIDIYKITTGDEPISFTVGTSLTVDEYIVRSKSFSVLEQYHHARAELLKGTQVNPARCDIYYHLGEISYRHEKYDQALKEFKKAEPTMSHHPEFYELVGDTYRKKGLLPEAQENYRQGIEYGPDSLSLYRRLVELSIECRDLDGARKTVLQGLDQCGDQVELLMLLAECHRRSDCIDLEYTTLEKVVRTDPERLEAYVCLAQISIAKNRRRNAFKWAKQILDRKPDSFQLCFDTGLVFKALNDWTLAADIWRHAAVVGKGTGHFYRELALLYLKLRRYDEAWNFAVRAESLSVDVEDLIREIQGKRLRF